MGNIINLDEHRYNPHISGKARCLSCKHEWMAVAPSGTCVLLCPKCEADGHMLGEVITDGLQWKCNCGWDLFRIDLNGPYCPNCAARVVND